MLLNVNLKCMYVCMYIIHKKLVGEKGERRKLVRNGEGKMAGFGQHFCRV